MKSSDLLSLLSHLESSLSDFSFEELNSEEASRLKSTFQAFKIALLAQVKEYQNTAGNTPETDSKNTTPPEEEDNTTVQRTKFNFFGLIRDVMFLCNTLVTQKEVTLTSAIGQGIPKTLIGDPSKLTHLLLHIMGNSIRSIEEGEINLSIAGTEQGDGRFVVEFDISHNAIGRANEQTNDVTDPSTNADLDAFEKHGGPELDLDVVGQIVEKLGGSINVKGNLNQGASFKFAIPYEQIAQDHGPKSTSNKGTGQDDTKSLKGLKVLVFEDDPLNQRLIEQPLKVWKCHVHITDSGQYGLHIIENNAIDVVLMDLRMPGISGFEATELIRSSSNESVRKVPIIALTADYTIRDQEKCNSYGIDDYLLKPFSHEELFSKLVDSQYPKKASESGPLPKDQCDDDAGENGLVKLDQMLEDCLGDKDMVEDLTLLFVKNISEFLKDAKNHILRKDPDGLGFSAHKIKAGLAMIEAVVLLNIIEDIRDGCKRNPDWKHLEFLYVRFLNEYGKVEKALERAIKNL